MSNDEHVRRTHTRHLGAAVLRGHGNRVDQQAGGLMTPSDRLRDLDGKPLYVQFQTPIMMPLDLQLEIKRQAAIKWLGTRWILHPANKVEKS